MLADDIDHTLARVNQIPERILCLIVPTRVAYDEDWWVVVDHLRVRERGKIRAGSIFRPRAHETNWSWNDGRDLRTEYRQSQPYLITLSGHDRSSTKSL